MMMLFAGLAASLLAWVEWRRPDRHGRAWRIMAVVVSAGALAWMGWSKSPREIASDTKQDEVLLWRLDESRIAIGSPPTPGAAATPDNFVAVPDIGYIRRHYPEVRRVRVIGALEEFELEGLRGLRVTHEPMVQSPQGLRISFLQAPRVLPLGSPVVVQGRVGGLRPGESAVVTFEGPDGTKAQTSVTGGEMGDAHFAINTVAPRAQGRFVWRLQLTRSSGESTETVNDERLGIAIVAPVLPRVLALDAAPRLDTAHLLRWFAEMRGRFVSRTLVSEGRHRFASSTGAPAEFAAVEAELLTEFDLVLLDARALAALAESERDTIRTAVVDQGLAVVVLPSGERGSLENLSHLPEAGFFLPWSFGTLPPPADAAEPERLARVQWSGLAAAVEEPIPVESLSLELREGQSNLVRDTQGRAIVSSTSRGRGQIALSLARETWRWQRTNQPHVFADYWSLVFSRLVKPHGAEVPQWTIANHATVPLVVNQPVELRYSTSASGVAPGEIAFGNEKPTTLPMAQDAFKTHTWHSTFWPRKSGWHQVSAANGGQLDFFVHEREEWPSLGPLRRQTATERFAALQAPEPAGELTTEPQRPLVASAPLFLFALFLCSTTYLWIERRTKSATSG